MRLPDEKRGELAAALCNANPHCWPDRVPCKDCCTDVNVALAPLVTRWLAEAWDEGSASLGPVWCLACDQEATTICQQDHRLTIRAETNPYRGGDS